MMKLKFTIHRSKIETPETDVEVFLVFNNEIYTVDAYICNYETGKFDRHGNRFRVVLEPEDVIDREKIIEECKGFIVEACREEAPKYRVSKIYFGDFYLSLDLDKYMKPI